MDCWSVPSRKGSTEKKGGGLNKIILKKKTGSGVNVGIKVGDSPDNGKEPDGASSKGGR